MSGPVITLCTEEPMNGNTQKYTQRIGFHSWITDCLLIRPGGYF